MTQRPKPFVLMVLDGWGINPRTEANAVAQAQTPNLDYLNTNYPHTAIEASATCVGLPAGQMGNSEVGHLNIGGGQIVYQELTRIDKAIADGEFATNSVLKEAITRAKVTGRKLHLFGLLGPGGVHSHWEHLYALARLCAQEDFHRVYVHAFTDGRDTPPQSALGYLKTVEKELGQIGVGQIASIAGRYYAMDRDNRWDRIEKAYRTLVEGIGPRAANAETAIGQSYAQGINDEFILPTIIEKAPGEPLALVEDGDSIIYYNFRADRARELTKAFVLPDFAQFTRTRQIADLYYATLTEYETGLPVHVAYPAMDVEHPLARVLADLKFKQFHTAETEKYAHVTFFFNGGRESPYEGEDRLLVPSPHVATYDLQPEMSALSLTDNLVARIESGEDDFIVVNYANGDMVGHTGILSAAIKAVETVDSCIGRVSKAVLAKGGGMVITADHGNCEQMVDYETGEPFTQHTTNPVPFMLILGDDSPYRKSGLRDNGILADVTPTILQILEIAQPEDMTGGSLIDDGQDKLSRADEEAGELASKH